MPLVVIHSYGIWIKIFDCGQTNIFGFCEKYKSNATSIAVYKRFHSIPKYITKGYRIKGEFYPHLEKENQRFVESRGSLRFIRFSPAGKVTVIEKGHVYEVVQEANA